jgi:shikimate dehydrogenase
MKVYGVIGDQRAKASLSPRMHNAVLARHGLEGCYTAFPVEPADLPAAVAGIKALGLAGANVTVPHKQAIAPLLDGLKGEAELLGAVNTIVPRDGKLWGHNTDVDGFANALGAAGFSPEGRAALVVGAGGAARAVVRALARQGADPLLVAGRNLDKVRALTDELGGRPLALNQAGNILARVELMVNSSAVSDPGEGPDLAALTAAWKDQAKSLALVVDINYGRAKSIWADLAKAAGAEHQDGLPMLAHQAALSFALWTGVDAPASEFLAELLD